MYLRGLIIIFLFGFTTAIQYHIQQNSNSGHKQVQQNNHRFFGSSEKKGSLNLNGTSFDRDFFGYSLIGFLLFIFGIPCLWFNERRYLVNQVRLAMAEKLCKEVNCLELDRDCQQKLVFTTGIANTKEILIDSQFAVSEANSIRVERIVEMFQWVETAHKNKNYTEYRHKQEWHQTFHDSDHFRQRFGHENDQSKWLMDKQTYDAQEVFLGEYILSDSLKQQTKKQIAILLNQENAKEAEKHFGGAHSSITCSNNCILFQQYPYTTSTGDFRVTFMKVPCNVISTFQIINQGIVSQQTNNTFLPFQIHDQYEETQQSSTINEIDWLYEFTTTKKQAFNHKLAENYQTTICTRFVIWLMMVIGLWLFFIPISFLISFLPFIGNFLAQVTGMIFFLLGFVIATPIALITIASAWLYYRPIIALILLSIAGAIGYMLFIYISKNNQ